MWILELILIYKLLGGRGWAVLSDRNDFSCMYKNLVSPVLLFSSILLLNIFGVKTFTNQRLSIDQCGQDFPTIFGFD